MPSNCGARVGDNCFDFTCDPGFQRAGTVTSLICMNSGEWNNDVSSLCAGIPIIILPTRLCHRQPSIINMVAHINSDKIVAGTSPTIKRSRLTQVSSATSQPVHTIPAGSKGTGSAAQTGAPRILLKDVIK